MNDSMINLRENLSQTNHTQNNSGSDVMLVGDYKSAFDEFKSKREQLFIFYFDKTDYENYTNKTSQ